MIKELQLLVLNYLPLTKLQSINNLTDQFWYNYLNTHYQLTKNFTDFNYKLAAIKIDKLLHILWYNKLYPTWRYPSFIIADMVDNNNIYTINYYRPLGNIRYNTNGLVKLGIDTLWLSELINFDIEPVNDLTSFDFNIELGLAEYSKIIKTIITPTLYLTPFGSKLVYFDIDKVDIITSKYSNIDVIGQIDLGSQLSEVFNSIGRNAYVLNFT